MQMYLFILAMLSWIGCVTVTAAHYSGWYVGNAWMWILWIVSSALSFYSAAGKKIRIRHPLIQRRSLVISILVSLLFLVTHIWNWSHAPWNIYGLFDDAAWDIYFANIHIGHAPFQAAFFDTVGYITRETVFHYYITAFFQLFGYNLFVFTGALLFLGYITISVTTLLIDRLFKNNVVTLCCALILNFFPLHYLHIFMGHRYAIAAPLMMLSLYFLYTAFMNGSSFRSALSALFGALCWGSAVMGKQYIYGLFLSGVFLLLFKKQRMFAWKYRHIIISWLISFLIVMTPVYIYILFHTSTYAIREQGLLQEFFLTIQVQGIQGLGVYASQIGEVFMSPVSYRRQFLVNYPVIPYVYYFLLLPSVVIVWIKKRYELIVLAILPVIGSFISGAYDFRILIAVPIWVLIMSYGIHTILRHIRLRIGMYILVIFGVLTTCVFVWNMSKNPHAQYLLPHKDVAVSRLIQDIVAGKEMQSVLLKWDEFRGEKSIATTYDVLMCPASAYAIMHVFLQAYDDKKILSFCDQGIAQLKTSDEVLHDNIRAILAYQPVQKDLKLIWEVTDTAHVAISIFSQIAPYGITEDIHETIEGIPFSLRVITIPQEQIQQFQHDVMLL